MTNRIRNLLLATPILFMCLFALCPLLIMVVVSFWQREGFQTVPAFSLSAYAEFLGGVRTSILIRSVLSAILATALSLVVIYPIAYLLARMSRPSFVRIVLILFTIPFLISYIIRNFAWAFILGRTGPLNEALIGLGVVDAPIDWLLYSTFAVYVGLIGSYMPFMLFPLWLALSGIDKRLIEASYLLGASPTNTFLRITLPLSLPGIFAASVFGLVGILGESAVSLILGGAGYELMGNTITSSMNVLNYPLAAAMSTITVAVMVLMLIIWYFTVDTRAFLRQIVGRSE